jgi:hypothetical protein
MSTSGGRGVSVELYGLVAGVHVDPSTGRTGVVSVRSLGEYLGRELRREFRLPDRSRERGREM